MTTTEKKTENTKHVKLTIKTNFHIGTLCSAEPQGTCASINRLTSTRSLLALVPRRYRGILRVRTDPVGTALLAA